MSIKLIIPSYLQPYTDNRESVEVSAKTVGECFDSLVKKHPGINKMLFDDNGKLHSYISIFINREDASHQQLPGTVKDGDEIHVIYTVGGG